MRVLHGCALLALVTCLTACGSDTSAVATSKTASPEAAPTDLTCPTVERVQTDGGYLAELPDGFDTREEAVEAFLANNNAFDDDYALGPDGKSAWVLRADGTAEARLTFLRHSGYTVHGYEACS